ncbi:MAG: hypothetical protein R3D29_09700 [Nitratireductor sp.]
MHRTSGRPGPVLIDIPKDVQFATGTYVPKAQFKLRSCKPWWCLAISN